MANDLSINSAPSYYPSVDRITPLDSTPKVKSENSHAHVKVTVESNNITVSDISNTKDMKRAELQGDIISVGEEQIIKAIERANKALLGRSTSFEFSIHEKTKQISIKVLDKDTGEIIREIPPEKALDMVAKMWEMAGLFLDERR